MGLLEGRLAHEPLLAMIAKNRGLIEQLAEDMRKLKDTEGKASLGMQMHKLEGNLANFKNEMQNQLYKMKEFDEQLFSKSLTLESKVDLELLKMRKQVQELQSVQDSVAKNVIANSGFIADLKESAANLAQSVIALVELECIASAMEQQHEVDRRGALN